MSKSGRGFTLLEMLVAVLVLALALMAAIRAAGVTLNSAEALHHRLAADWLASDLLAEHLARRTWPAVGERSGSASQAGIPLRWREQVSETPNSRFRRIELTVFDAEREDIPLATLSGFAVNRSR